MILGRPVFVLMMFFTGVADASGYNPEVFSISGIKVDETSETAAKARDVAFAKGQKLALSILLRRLTRDEDVNSLPIVDDEQLEFLVQALEVAEERLSDIRYIANLTVRFKPLEIRRLLRESGVPYAESTSKPILVIPLLRKHGSLLLWDEGNFWRNAWLDLPLSNGLVPQILPIGDLSDITDIDASKAADGDPTGISSIANRYGAGQVLIAFATVSETVAGKNINISTTQIGGYTEKPIIFNLDATNSESLQDLFVNAALKLSAMIENNWTTKNIIEFDRPKSTLINVPLNSLEEWVVIENRLSKIASIFRVEIRSFSIKSVFIEIYHYGDKSQMANTLLQEDLVIETFSQADQNIEPGINSKNTNLSVISTLRFRDRDKE
tara:strand:+ start:14548 stop:15693 length:1146 start_codon:yes stop_codon:yes gene_type:complete